MGRATEYQRLGFFLFDAGRVVRRLAEVMRRTLVADLAEAGRRDRRSVAKISAVIDRHRNACIDAGLCDRLAVPLANVHDRGLRLIRRTMTPAKWFDMTRACSALVANCSSDSFNATSCRPSKFDRICFAFSCMEFMAMMISSNSKRMQS